jgi:hypothetical protein
VRIPELPRSRLCSCVLSSQRSAKPPGLRTVARTMGLTALAVMVLSGSASGQGTVRVTVTESTGGNGTRYAYWVENRTTQPIVGLRVGFDLARDRPQLHERPLGWTFDAGLPSSSAGAPRGWTLRVVTTEESDLIYLDWSSDGDPRWDIAPGTVIGGFAVTLARASGQYRTVRFDAVLGNSSHVTGTLAPRTPPSRP